METMDGMGRAIRMIPNKTVTEHKVPEVYEDGDNGRYGKGHQNDTKQNSN